MSDPSERLRRAVSDLPSHTRAAMLEALQREQIIAGAYTDGRGGVCPLLAAHRLGGRSDAEGFAGAWDAYIGARRRARAATRGQLDELRALLLESFLDDESWPHAPGPSAEGSRSLAQAEGESRRSGGVVPVPPAGFAQPELAGSVSTRVASRMGLRSPWSGSRAAGACSRSVRSPKPHSPARRHCPMALGASRLLHHVGAVPAA